MDKKILSRIILAVMIIMNIYLIWRVNSNTMSIAAYDAGINQRTGVGRLESFWTKYIGGSKNYSTYEDRQRAEADSNTTIAVLFVADIVFVAVLYVLNRKPKPAPVKNDDDWRTPRRSRRR
ncbi:MAG: hypothetical protein IJL14_09495 [Selenomonadaceae bacterium]|nr:hypothetical protein [Selenomonadaceae bacterium]